MTPKLLTLAKVSSVLGNILDVSFNICQSMGGSLIKGKHFPFWTRMVRTKIKPDLQGHKTHLILEQCVKLIQIFPGAQDQFEDAS